MTVMDLREFLVWCSILNSAVLLFWWLMYVVAGDFIYRTHGRWFDIPRDRFDAIHYQGVMYYKILVILLNVVPMAALFIIA